MYMNTRSISLKSEYYIAKSNREREIILQWLYLTVHPLPLTLWSCCWILCVTRAPPISHSTHHLQEGIQVLSACKAAGAWIHIFKA